MRRKQFSVAGTRSRDPSMGGRHSKASRGRRISLEVRRSVDADEARQLRAMGLIHGEFVTFARALLWLVEPNQHSLCAFSLACRSFRYHAAKHVSSLRVNIAPSACAGDEIRNACASFPHLRKLRIVGTTGAVVQRLFRARHEVVDDALYAVALGAPDLTSFEMWQCGRVTDAGIAALLEPTTCSPLTNLDLAGCRLLTDSAVLVIAERATELRSLSLFACDLVTSAGVAAVARSCPFLTRINLSSCTRIDDESLRAIGENCPLMRTVDFHGCSREWRAARCISDAGVRALARGCRELRNVDLSECINIGDAAIEALVSSCGRLETLLLGCCLISNKALVAMGRLPELRVVDVAFPNHVRGAHGVTVLVSHCQKLRSLNLRGCMIPEHSLSMIAEWCGESLRHLMLTPRGALEGGSSGAVCAQEEEGFSDESIAALRDACPQIEVDIGPSSRAQGCVGLVAALIT